MPSTHTIQDSDNDGHLLSSDAPGPSSQPRSRRNSHISQDPDPEVEKSSSHSRRRQRKTRCRTMSVERTEYINEGNDRSDDDQNINDDSDASASGASEGEDHSRTPHISHDHDPKVKKSTSPSRRRRRKTRCRIMGMERAEYINRGNNPFDYEQKFPEDKRGEELGPTARVWRTCLEESAASDGEMVEGWRDGLDVLLVFAGLFSAVVTTFVAQTSQSLQVNYGQVTTLLLIELINIQRSTSNGSLVNDVPHTDLTFSPSTSDSWVNGLWFTNLSLSLTAALFAVLTKQWIHQYLSVPSGSPRDRCRVRQFRYMGLEQWGVGLIIGLLPVLLSASLAVFLVGLVVFIIPLRVSVASVVGAITFISFSAYIVMNFLPVIYLSCPYKTPLSQYMFPIYAYIRRQIPGLPTAPSRTLKKAESMAVRNNANDIDAQALVWLIDMSSNPSVANIVIESMSALPLQSVGFFKCHVEHTDVALACRQALERAMPEPDVPVHKGQVDRLIRATLRFTFPPTCSEGGKPAKNCLSPTLYTVFLYMYHNCQEEIRELVMSNLMASKNDVTALRLQPIVWVHLLWMLTSSPDNRPVMQMLFANIPLLYWEADHVPNTFTLEHWDIKIPYGSDDDNVTLRMAIHSTLYIYVTRMLYHYCMCSEPSIFPLPNGTFNHHLRLPLLLCMAGSCTMRIMADSCLQNISDSYFNESIEQDTSLSSFASNQSTFIMIMESIGSMVDIGSPHKDNDNRLPALEFLHTLITSDEFDDPLTSHEQAYALTMFLHLVNCTSSRPPFLEKDWCTPQLATKFLQITLNFSGSSTIELGTYLFRHTSFTNETMASFVSDLLKQFCLGQSSDWTRWEILCMIITGLGSEQLVRVCQQSLEYLHEPDNIFTACAALIQRNDTQTLRRLALLHPEHGSWSGCIQQLEDSDIDRALVADFKAFIQAGCVGAYGEDHAAPQEENDRQVPVQHPPSTVWCKVQRFITGKPRRGGIELLRNDSRV